MLQKLNVPFLMSERVRIRTNDVTRALHQAIKLTKVTQNVFGIAASV